MIALTILSLAATTLPVSAAPAVQTDGEAAVEIIVDGPERGTQPGRVRLWGRVRGSYPFVFSVNGTPERVSNSGRWESWLELEVGNNQIQLELTDSTGAKVEFSSDLVALPNFDPKDTRQIVFVSSAEELIKNLGDKRILVLRPGDYVLNQVDAALMPAKCEKAEGTGNVVLRDTFQLAIVGTAGRTSRIVNNQLGGTALVLRACEKTDLYALEFAHELRDEKGAQLALPEKSSGGVINLGGTYVTRFWNCAFTGEGVGFAVRKINAFALVESVIRDCTGGAFRSVNSKHMTISDSELLGNGRGRPGDIVVALHGYRADILFEGCTLRNNKPGPKTGLFDIDKQGLISYFKDGVIEDNDAKFLTSGPAKDHFEAVKSRVQKFADAK